MMADQRKEFVHTTNAISRSVRVAWGVSVSARSAAQSGGMVLRRIESKIPTIDELQLPPIINELAMTKRGLVIFVGATGTGKSTSLAAMVGLPQPQ
jgi:twitching motility protein PilU